MPTARKPQPTLFSLLEGFNAEERQRFSEHRRAMKARDGFEERLVRSKDASWRLEYWKEGKKIDEILLPRKK